VLKDEEFRQRFQEVVAEAFRQGGRGPAHDYGLEGRPWGIPVSDIRVPVTIWHGEDDRMVPVTQGRILAAAMPSADRNFLPGIGHFSLGVRHGKEILRSALGTSGYARG
jgi:pimeloyl-ACP methyl ester carboxylesterase